MLTTLGKLGAFSALVIVLYFMVPKKKQWCILLLANILFYLYFGIQYMVFIVLSIVITYITGRVLEQLQNRYKACTANIDDRDEKKRLKSIVTKKKRMVLALSLSINMGIWFVMKYLGFLATQFNSVLGLGEGTFSLPVLKLALPLGMSYYSFVAAGYCIDVYRGKYAAEKNILHYATFLSFFLQMIEGPFSRFDALSKTLFEEHQFSKTRFCDGSIRVVWGIFKKCMVADKLSVAVVYIYQNYEQMNGIYIFIAIIFFAMELYADFSGYMDIMLGIAHIMGITMQENFKQPFFSRSIEELWRRWHITLGAWFKDYLFYPVSMSKWAQNLGKNSRKILGTQTGRLLPSYLALVLVWSATGLWHGAAMHYLIWGLMQMIVIMFSMQMTSVYDRCHKFFHISADTSVWHGIQMIRTFILFGFMEVMSEAGSVSQAFHMYGKLFNKWDFNILSKVETIFVTIPRVDIVVAMIGIFTIIVVDVLKEKQIEMRTRIQRIPAFPRYVIYLGVIYMIILFTTRGDGAGGFMYANF